MQFAIIAFTLLCCSYIISNLLEVHCAFKPFHLRHVLGVKGTFTSSAYQRNSWYDNPKVKTIHVVTDESQYDRRMKHGGSWWTFNVLSRYVDYTDDIAVSKNPETGSYEAYRVTVACN